MWPRLLTTRKEIGTTEEIFFQCNVFKSSLLTFINKEAMWKSLNKIPQKNKMLKCNFVRFSEHFHRSLLCQVNKVEKTHINYYYQDILSDCVVVYVFPSNRNNNNISRN